MMDGKYCILKLLLFLVILECCQCDVLPHDVAYPGKYPWQVSITNFGKHKCSGVLIGHRYVLTAAHCVAGKFVYNLKAVVGLHQLSDETKGQPRKHEVKAIWTHYEYNMLSRPRLYDLAVLELREIVQLWNNDYVNIMPMPTNESLSTYSNCVLTGWNLRNNKGKQVSDTLQELKIKDIPLEECANKFDSRFQYELDSYSHMCFYEFDENCKDECLNRCQGMNGGPAVCEVDGEEVLVGISSTANGQCKKNQPLLYSSLHKSLDWINFILRNSS